MARRREPGYARALKGSRGFYADVAGFADFSRFPDDENYRTAPAEWLVVVTDIERSTQAIADGRYKDVNMVAAASIVAVLNAAGEPEIPFVFGGDGATLLVPPESAAAVRAALAKLSRLSDDSFNLTLRVGMVPIRELVAKGRAVRVARFELSPGNTSALFGGGGVELAETLVKSPSTCRSLLGARRWHRLRRPRSCRALLPLGAAAHPSRRRLLDPRPGACADGGGHGGDISRGRRLYP